MDLPDDPEIAFVIIEANARKALYEALEYSNYGTSNKNYYLQYMNIVIASINELSISDLGEIGEIKFPSTDPAAIENFTTVIDQYVNRIKIRKGVRERRYSVALDANTKSKIRTYLDNIKSLINESEIDPARRESIFKKILILERELEKERSKFEIFADLVFSTVDIVESSIQRAPALRKFVLDIIKAISADKAKEQHVDAQVRLSISGDVKRISPPPVNGESQADDDIPF